MGYRKQWFLFWIYVILLLGSIVLLFWSVILLFINPAGWQIPLILLGVGMLSGTFSFLFYLIRKTRFPVPGIDYK